MSPTSSYLIFTTPIHLSSIPDSPHCAICKERLGSLSDVKDASSSIDDEQEQEYPVRVDIVATPSGSHRLCGHIFGRRCLEKHLKTKGAWSRFCPLCRDAWYTKPEQPERPGRTLTSSMSARSLLRLHQSEQRAREQTEEQRAFESAMQMRREQRLVPGEFMRSVLDELKTEAGSHEIKGSVDDVERALQQVYKNMRERETAGEAMLKGAGGSYSG